MCDDDDRDFYDGALIVTCALTVILGILGAGIGLAVCLLIGSDRLIAASFAGFLIGSPLGCFLGLGLFLVAVNQLINQLKETSKSRSLSDSTSGKPVDCDCSEIHGVTP